MEREAIVVYAEKAPLTSVRQPRPNQLYRNPRVNCERRKLQVLAPDSIRVEMLYAGVCGTDLHLVQADPRTGYVQTSSPALLPAEGRIIGHEGVGRILETGSNVRHLEVGAFVVFESIVACYRCDCCRRGQFNQCRNGRLLGMEEDGLFATITDVPASVVHDISEFVSDEAEARKLASLEPCAVAFLACERAHISPGERVAIFGAGPIGVYCAILARGVFGAGDVHLVEPLPFRRKFAEKWADHTHSAETFPASEAGPIDVVIEASGDLSTIDRALPMMNAGGRILLLGRAGRPLEVVDADYLITNAISITGSRGHLGGAFDSILKLFSKKLFDPSAAVTDEIAGIEKLQAFLLAPDGVSHQSCKVLVNFKGSVTKRTSGI